MPEDFYAYQHKRQIPKQRSIDIVHTYLQKGHGVSRSVWVRISHRHPLLKLIVAPPLVLAAVALLFMLLALGFTLAALSLFWALSKQKQ